VHAGSWSAHGWAAAAATAAAAAAAALAAAAASALLLRAAGLPPPGRSAAARPPLEVDRLALAVEPDGEGANALAAALPAALGAADALSHSRHAFGQLARIPSGLRSHSPSSAQPAQSLWRSRQIGREPPPRAPPVAARLASRPAWGSESLGARSQPDAARGLP